MTTKPVKTPPLPLFDELKNLAEKDFNTLVNHEAYKRLPTEAGEDFNRARNFLLSYRGSIATFNAYRREVERFLQWSWLMANKSLKEIKRDDVEIYIEFCQNPPAHWIGTKHVTRFMDQEGSRLANPSWRPFVATVTKKAFRAGMEPDIERYQLSQKALQAIFAILGSFYNFLIQDEYAAFNPIAQIRQKSKFIRKYQNKAPIRRLSELQWAYVIETAEAMANANPEHERTLFIMNALFGLYLRISELSVQQRWQPQMGHFFKDLDGHWWFKTVGKGNKERDISVSDAMLQALKRYRLSLGLTAFPSPGEATPLLPSRTHKNGISGVRHIRKIVQHCFDQAIIRMEQDGIAEEADALMSATVHWLRHTGISEDVKSRPREHVRDDAGHSSSAITDKYIDIETRARHASAKKKLIKPEI
jgi:site-specific recombinase XerD